jgi:hypothetical protein
VATAKTLYIKIKKNKKQLKNSTRQTGLNDVLILAAEHKEATNSGIQELITDIKGKNKGQKKCLNWGLIDEFLEKQQIYKFFDY